MEVVNPETVDWRRAGFLHSVLERVNMQLWECNDLTLSLSSNGELAGGGRSCREACRKMKLHSGVNS